FFQAEDGIRDFHVTGVQTCALPIFRRGRAADASGRRFSRTARLRENEAMRVHIGSDHAGLELKDHLLNWLVDNGYEAVDHGPFEIGRASCRERGGVAVVGGWRKKDQ